MIYLQSFYIFSIWIFNINYFLGQADSVRCFMCGTGLRNWDPEDEPWVEHARWAPECYYVRDKKGQDFINLVQVAVRQQQMVKRYQFLIDLFLFAS